MDASARLEQLLSSAPWLVSAFLIRHYLNSMEKRLEAAEKKNETILKAFNILQTRIEILWALRRQKKERDTHDRLS